jgi:hypothetical protein
MNLSVRGSNRRSNQGRLEATVVVVALACALGVWFWYMQLLHPDVAFMDTLRFLSYFDASERGERSIWSTWNQGQHRGLLPQTFVYLNAKYFGFNVYYAALSAGVFIALTYVVVIWDILRHRVAPVGTCESWWFALSVCMTVVALFSFSNWELYSLDVGSALFLKNLIFVIFWFFVSRLSATSSSTFRFALMVAGPCIVMLIAFGWAFPFVGATVVAVIVVNGFERIKASTGLVALLGLLIISLVAYVLAGALGALTVAPRNFDQQNAGLNNFVSAIFLAFGSIFVGIETSSVYKPLMVLQGLGAGACIVGIGFLLADSLKFNGRPISQFLPMALLIYGVIDLVLVAFARGRFEPTSAMASRYFSDFCFIPIGVVWLTYFDRVGGLSKTLAKQGRASKVQLCAVGIMVTCFLVGQALTSIHEWKKAPYRSAAFNEMRQATVRAAHGDRDVSMLQAPTDVAIKGARVQRDYGIGVFTGLRCSYKAAGDGWIEASHTVTLRNCGADLRLEFFLPNNFPEKIITVKTNGKAERISLRPGEARVIIVARSDTQAYEIAVEVDELTRVSEIDPTSADSRSLGVIFASASSESVINK